MLPEPRACRSGELTGPQVSGLGAFNPHTLDDTIRHLTHVQT
jgi:hypothetical protein